jgi:hypothetical protein
VFVWAGVSANHLCDGRYDGDPSPDLLAAISAPAAPAEPSMVTPAATAPGLGQPAAAAPVVVGLPSVSAPVLLTRNVRVVLEGGRHRGFVSPGMSAELMSPATLQPFRDAFDAAIQVPGSSAFSAISDLDGALTTKSELTQRFLPELQGKLPPMPFFVGSQYPCSPTSAAEEFQMYPKEIREWAEADSDRESGDTAYCFHWALCDVRVTHLQAIR